MQEMVTLKGRKKRRQNVCLIALISVFVVIFIFIIFFGLFLEAKQIKVFKEQSFYLVCANNSRNLKDLENIQDEIKKFGGAGKIYKKELNYFLIINMYLEKEQAENVLINNKQSYENASILEIKTKKVSKKSIKKIRNNQFNFKFIKVLSNSIQEISKLSLKYINSEISENELCSKLLAYKFELETLNDELKKLEPSEVNDLVQNYSQLLIMYFDSYFNNFFGSDKKVSVLIDFVVSIGLLKVDFFNNL